MAKSTSTSPTKETPPASLDQNEARQSPWILKELKPLIPVTVQDNDVGDVICEETPITYGIERKALNNLAGSLASNELDDQLSRMLDAFDASFLLVEGLPTPGPDGRFRAYGTANSYSYAWFMGAILGWTLRGIIPILVPSMKATARAIASIHNTCAKPDHRETYEPRRLLPNLRMAPLTQRILMQIDGVGPTRAEQTPFEHPYQIGEASLATMKKLLGPKTGGRVYEEWHGE